MPFAEMRGRDRALCLFYGLFSVGGGLVMGSMAVAYVLDHAHSGAFGLVRDFLRDASVNLAARFVYADLVLVWAALAVFMVLEARRLGIRHVWAYIVGAPVLALCVSFPVFMFVRQLKIAAATESVGMPGARLPAAASPATRGTTRGTQR
ncbi:DUF2834 domain-containing protein [Streptomyces sp. CA-250714]|uniref:DUF2834 domain-containing protein n=1 Tax=Streptomyces sp. CA-250714 TaxID=3240060 RepID=UPI003D89DBF0